MEHNHASALAYAVEGPVAEGWVGREVRTTAQDRVEAGRVADFCALVGEADPVYWDEVLATARFGGPVAPPATLMVWRFSRPWSPRGRPEYGPMFGLQVPLPVNDLINVSTETTYFAPIRIGTRLSFLDRIVSVSGPKQTALGTGYFVTDEFDAFDEQGLKIATNRNVMLRFRANGSARAASPPPEPLAGASLPELRIPVTQTLCTLDAAATRDYFPGHHDGVFARHQGIPDAYPNTMFYQGLVDRIALEWARGQATIAGRRLTMASPAPIGEILRTRGKVTARDGDAAELLVEVVTDAALVARATVNLRLRQRHA